MTLLVLDTDHLSLFRVLRERPWFLETEFLRLKKNRMKVPESIRNNRGPSLVYDVVRPWFPMWETAPV